MLGVMLDSGGHPTFIAQALVGRWVLDGTFLCAASQHQAQGLISVVAMMRLLLLGSLIFLMS